MRRRAPGSSRQPASPPRAIAATCISCARHREHQQRRHHREARARPIGAQLPSHAPYGLRDDGDRRDLEAVQPPRLRRALQQTQAIAERDHDQRRRQREADPRCDRPCEVPRAMPPARCRPGCSPDPAGTGTAQRGRRTRGRRASGDARRTRAENSRDARSDRRTTCNRVSERRRTSRSACASSARRGVCSAGVSRTGVDLYSHFRCVARSRRARPS